MEGSSPGEGAGERRRWPTGRSDGGEVADAVRALGGRSTAEAVARTALDAVEDLLGCPHSVVYLRRDSGDRLEPAAWSEGIGAGSGGTPPSIGAGAESGRSGFVPDRARICEGRCSDLFGEDTDLRSELHLPLGEHGVIVGASASPDAFDEADLALGRIVAAAAEAALGRAERERELRRQNERLEEFASMVSHDLRGPVNVASGYLALVREERDDDRLEKAATALDRVETRIEDMLAFARKGRVVDEPEAVDLRSTIDAAWTTVGDEGSCLRVVDGLGTVEGDPERLRELFENVLRNAVEHAEGAATVRVGPLDDGFYVEDDGPGIPEDEREPVFEAGYSTAEGGTGLGLAIVDRIADAHGWEVSVVEGANGGARFEVTGVAWV